jgi:hypothetical protein
MQDNKKVYGKLYDFDIKVSRELIHSDLGFTIALYEFPETIWSLWNATRGKYALVLENNKTLINSPRIHSNVP